MPRIDPERHKAARRSTLPRTPCNTIGILVPDLPPQFKKSSQRTLATHTSTSGSEEDQDEEEEDEEEEEEEEEEAFTRRPSFFIPGITAKALCLTTPPIIASASSVDTADAPNIRNNNDTSPSKQTTTTAEKTTTKPSLLKTTTSSTSSATMSRMSNTSIRSHMTDKSRESYLSSHSRRSHTSTDDCSPEELEEAIYLYDSVVSSIQSRRETEVDEVLLDEMDYQRMLQELQPVSSSLVNNNVQEEQEHSLRDQVDSIRDLLNEYYDRKNKQNDSSSRSALDYLQASGNEMVAVDSKHRRRKSNRSKSRLLHQSYNHPSIIMDGSTGSSGYSSREDDEDGDGDDAADQNRPLRRKSVHNKLGASDNNNNTKSRIMMIRTSDDGGGGYSSREDDNDEVQDAGSNKHASRRSGVSMRERKPKPSPRSRHAIGIGGGYSSREEDDDNNEDDCHHRMRRKDVYKLGLTNADNNSSSAGGYSSREEDEEDEAALRHTLDQLGLSEGKSKSLSRSKKSSSR